MEAEMEAATAEMTVVERFQLKAFVEAVMVVDEGVSTTKDVDLGLMMGAGILPGPLARADEAGLDEMLERLQIAQREWGDGFAPPLLLRRLVNQGRLGKKTGQGFFFYPRPDDDFDQKETVLLETHDEIAVVWLNRPPTNPISPQMIRDLTAVWDEIESRDEIHGAVFASSNFAVFCARSEEHTSELQSHRDLHSFPTRRSSDLAPDDPRSNGGVGRDRVPRRDSRGRIRVLQLRRLLR